MNLFRRFRSIIPLALAAVFALSAQAIAAGNAADGKSDQPVTDTWITTKVKSELATTKGVKSMDIDVKTVDGVVTLSGTQADAMAVDKAVTAAKSVKGVKRVDAAGLKAAGGASP